MSSQVNSSLPHQDGATIDPAVSVLKFQTIQEAINQFSTLTEEEFDKGEDSLAHEFCIQCLSPIDTATCRSFDKGWAVGWHCAACGYVKHSKEMLTSFLKGADNIRELDKADIANYLLKQFRWLEDSKEDTSLNQFYIQVGCAVHKEGSSLRQALGDADFFAYTGIFDVLARAWCEERKWQFIATRLQGVILIRHDKSHKNYRLDREAVKEEKKLNIPAPLMPVSRKVNQFRLVKSDMRSGTGRNLSVCVLAEHSIDDDGEPVACSKPGTTRSFSRQPDNFAKNCLGRVIKATVTGIHRIHHEYIDNEAEDWTYQEIMESSTPETVQRSWDLLFQTLTRIQNNLPKDGDHAIIRMNASNDCRAPKGSITIQKKAPIDLNCLREDFREAFNL